MTSQPFTTMADVMAEVDRLAELHTAADQAHAEATAEAQKRRPASPFDTVEDENVGG